MILLRINLPIALISEMNSIYVTQCLFGKNPLKADEIRVSRSFELRTPEIVSPARIREKLARTRFDADEALEGF